VVHLLLRLVVKLPSLLTAAAQGSFAYRAICNAAILLIEAQHCVRWRQSCHLTVTVEPKGLLQQSSCCVLKHLLLLKPCCSTTARDGSSHSLVAKGGSLLS
jgi:hypothetical protein